MLDVSRGDVGGERPRWLAFRAHTPRQPQTRLASVSADRDAFARNAKSFALVS